MMVDTQRMDLRVGERMPPHSVEAEEAVLGSAMIDPEAMERLVRVLHPLDFYIVKNQWAFEAMLAMRERGTPIDFVTICQELEARGQLKEMGGAAYLSFLINGVPTAIHAEGYAKIVKKASVRRGALGIASEIAQLAYDESNDVIMSLQEAATRITTLKFAAISRLNSRQSFMSSDEVLMGDWPEPVWVVPDLLTSGLGFIHGKPKRGKSWLMMQVSCAKATGGKVFNRTIEPGPVLYFALEDNLRRLKFRQKKQLWPRGAAIDFVLAEQFAQEFGNLAEGGTDRIAYLVNERGYQLVVIDTFNRAVGQYLKASESNDAGVITKALDRLQRFAVDKNICVMFVDHQSKASKDDSSDAIGDVFGSIAKSGVSDVMWGFYREPGSINATLSISGRDVEEQTLLLSWDKEFGQWNYAGNGEGVRMTSRRQEILDALNTFPEKRATLTALSDYIKQPKSHTSDRLADLVKSGLIKRGEKGDAVWFELADDGVPY